MPASVSISFTTTAPGNFTLPHNLGVIPNGVSIQMTAAGIVWFQSPIRYDANNLYLVASDSGLTGTVVVYGPSTACATPFPKSTYNPFVTLAPGAFQLAHGLGVTPSSVVLQFTDAGVCWFQSVMYDADYVYLVASDANVTGVMLAYSPTFAPMIF